MTPTLAGTTIVLGDARLTADEARTLARNLHRAADEAEGAVRTLRADEARAQREAKIRADGGVECVALGRPTVGRLTRTPYGLRVQTPDGPQMLSRVDLWPEPVRVRVAGGRVAHVWQGGIEAVCGQWLGKAREIAAPDLRDCPRCGGER